MLSRPSVDCAQDCAQTTRDASSESLSQPHYSDHVPVEPYELTRLHDLFLTAGAMGVLRVHQIAFI